MGRMNLSEKINVTTPKEYVAVAESIDEVYDKLRETLGDHYEVIEKETKRQFPLWWKKRYHYRAVMKMHVTPPAPSDQQRKKLIDLIDNPPSAASGEIEELKSLLKEFKGKIPPTEVSGFLAEESEKPLLLFYTRLIENEVEEPLAKSLIEKVKGDLPPGQWKAPAIETALKTAMMESMEVFGSFEEPALQTIALIGPTGVGKTTTLVKIATSLKTNTKDIGLITTDNYRVAAFDQLREYAEKLGCPMIKSEPEELYDPIDVFKYQKGMDHILVDTSGRSPMNKGLIDEIKSYLEVVQPDHVALVLSSTQKYSDMIRTLDNYKGIKINSLILTKLDETMSYGFLYNIMTRYRLPISYLTAGQEVPDDIEVATKERLVEWIVNGVGHDESSK